MKTTNERIENSERAKLLANQEQIMRDYFERVGSMAAVARNTSIPYATLSQYATRQRLVTIDYARKIEQLTDGGMTARELRPDLFK